MKYHKLYKILTIIIFIALWQVTSIILGRGEFFPSPFMVYKKMLILLSDSKTYIIIINSLKHLLLSFFLSLIVGFILGVPAALYKIFDVIISPIILVIRSIPTISVILIILLYINQKSAPIIICFLIVFPIIFSNVKASINNVDPKLIEMSNIFALSKSSIIKNIYIPSIRINLLSVIDSALGLNFKVNIAAEVIAMSRKSIGESIYLSKVNIDYTGVFAWTIIIIVLSFLFEYIIKKIKDGGKI